MKKYLKHLEMNLRNQVIYEENFKIYYRAKSNVMMEMLPSYWIAILIVIKSQLS
jgi:hypothetical protein